MLLIIWCCHSRFSLSLFVIHESLVLESRHSILYINYLHACHCSILNVHTAICHDSSVLTILCLNSSLMNLYKSFFLCYFQSDDICIKLKYIKYNTIDLSIQKVKSLSAMVIFYELSRADKLHPGTKSLSLQIQYICL